MDISNFLVIIFILMINFMVIHGSKSVKKLKRLVSPNKYKENVIFNVCHTAMSFLYFKFSI